MAKQDNSPKFTFQWLSNRKYPSIESKETQELLQKWGMEGRLKVKSFSFDQHFHPDLKDEFVQNMFKDANVRSTIEISSISSIKSVTADTVMCSIISMDFFDRLVPDIVKKTGHIKKCFDEFVDDFAVSDELRKILLMEESEYYDIYSTEEREEFLFLLFRHLCLGGQVCQYEDMIEAYLDTTKSLYKDLVSVVKDGDIGKLRVVSQVFKVTISDERDVIFPADTDHIQNFAYIVVDPYKRTVNLICHRFGGW